MASRTRTIEVDLDDFDAEDILEAARGIAARVGSDEFDLSSGLVADLAADIVQGRTDSALVLLDRLVGESPALRQAIDVGRRRVPR